jgi:DNA-binding XRE family transcriptional regulator
VHRSRNTLRRFSGTGVAQRELARSSRYLSFTGVLGLHASKQGASGEAIRHRLNALQDIQLIVAERIKKIRKAKGITQEELADRAGVNRTHMYRLEGGKQSMTLRTLKIIADALDVRVRELAKDL